MALAQPAEAEIVYTPANATIPFDRGLTIDLNHDGGDDFRFFFYTFAYHSFRGELSVYPVHGGGVITGAGKYASPLFRGNSIGPARVFLPGAAVMFRSQGVEIYSSSYHRSVFGPWVNVQNRYLGVEVPIDGVTHYGWIRLSSTIGKYRVSAFTLTGYAYETVAGQPIKAGQLTEEARAPAESAPLAEPSLGMLALESQGLELWRREEPLLSEQ
jgi:hypothetical protein